MVRKRASKIPHLFHTPVKFSEFAPQEITHFLTLSRAAVSCEKLRYFFKG